ncbi:hypothetical protein IST455A_00191 [Burkholderia multivorans]|nr:hypothetical protein IST455A_00191 [Burkholderia multivorans]
MGSPQSGQRERIVLGACGAVGHRRRLRRRARATDRRGSADRLRRRRLRPAAGGRARVQRREQAAVA